MPKKKTKTSSKKTLKKKTLTIRLDLGGDLRAEETHVRIYRASKKKPKKVGEAVIDGRKGKVEISAEAGRLLYCVAEVWSTRDGDESREVLGRKIELLAVFGHGARKVTLSEPTTVGSVYAFARFLRVTKKGKVKIAGPKRGLRIARGMLRNLVTRKGKTSKVLATSPNGLESNSYPKFNSLSNLVHYSLTTQAVYDAFLQLTDARTLLGAIHRLALEPFTDVTKIYGLIYRRKPVYSPSLAQLEEPATRKPDHWALSVKVNDSGAENFLIAGVGYATFDENDRLWLATNVRQGTPNSATFCVVLEPDGRPAPFSPVFGGGILGAGFGVVADPPGKRIYVGSFGWGATEQNPQRGAVAAFSSDGTALSPPDGYTEKLSRVQGMTFDADGNLWMASWGTQEPLPPTDSRYRFPGRKSAVVVYPGADPERAIRHEFDSEYAGTFDVAIGPDGAAYVSNSGSGAHGVRSSVHKFRLGDGRLEEVAAWHSDYQPPADAKHAPHPGVETLRQVTVAPCGDVFVVAVSSSRVIRFDPEDLRPIGEYTKEIYGPWGIVFDPDGTMFVSNFSRDIDFTSDEPIGPYGVTVIRDDDESTARLLTLQTGGRQVRLANGLPLYGNGVTATGPDGEAHDGPIPSYDPIMRLTGSRVDRAGNLWACNNWKPSAAEDVVYGDPGGDGLVCFVGVAAPSKAR